MAEIQVGSVVASRAGRDKERFMAVVGIENGYVLLCDGKERPLEKPKRKNPKHVAVTHTELDAAEMATNRSLRKALALRNQTEPGLL